MSDEKRIAKERVVSFQRTILRWYKKHGRHDLPWRQPSRKASARHSPPSLRRSLGEGELRRDLTLDPYRILVSEVMLQQTQIPRVLEKYKEFLRIFPSMRALARANTRDVLATWQGLGYNRRALYLQRAVQQIMDQYQGIFPKDAVQLEALSGIGPYTARAVTVFSWNAPEILLETNIRRVMLHFFFPDVQRVPDSHIEPLLQRVLYKKDPRTWYWALMDYGAGPLKKVPNPNRRSKHYSKQSRFEGSRRYVRAKVISILLRRKRGLTVDALVGALLKDPHCNAYLEKNDISAVLDTLLGEGLIRANKNAYSISSLKATS